MNVPKSTVKTIAGIGIATAVVFGIVNANATTTETVEEVEMISYATDIVNDDTIYEGETEVRQEGEYGSKIVTYSVRYKNGKEIDKTRQSEKVTKTAQNKIVAKGTKKKPEPKPEPTPAKTAPVAPVQKQSTGARVGAICRDGWRSSATGRGACSHHGGVSTWLYD